MTTLSNIEENEIAFAFKVKGKIYAQSYSFKDKTPQEITDILNDLKSAAVTSILFARGDKKETFLGKPNV